MMRTKHILLIVIALVVSCTERVDFDLEEAGEPRLVVFSEITNDKKAHEVKLGKSAPYFHNQPTEMVSGATITIQDGIGTIHLTEDKNRPGVYLTPDLYYGRTGRTYQLEISDVDVNDDGVLENYSAETKMMASAPVQAIQVAYTSRWKGWDVAIYSKDPAETTDYYLFKVYKNGVLYTDSISDYWTSDDRFFNGNEINGPVVQYFDEEKGEIVAVGDTITLEMAGITKEYYDFIAGVFTETNEKVPIFSGPSANLKGNISNGALGFFAVMEVERHSGVYHGE
jgi:hypothetical protein